LRTKRNKRFGTGHHGRKDPLNIEVIDFSKEDTVQAVFDKVPGGMLLPLQPGFFVGHKMEEMEVVT
jgi:hypothetical protein